MSSPSSSRRPLYVIRGPKLLHELTMKEVADKLDQTDVVVFAGASTEAHGNHLPLAADAIQAEELLRLVVERLEADGCPAVGGPVIPFGPTTDRMGFPGTLSISNSTMIALLKEIAHSLFVRGFRKFALLMYHFDNMAPMTVAVRELIDEFPPEAQVMMLQGFLRAHGGEMETSRVMAAREALVDLEMAEPSYPVKQPTFAIDYDRQVLHGGSIFRPPRDYHLDAPLGYVGNPTLPRPKKAGSAMRSWRPGSPT